jgi:hypothetical protein
MNFIFRKIKLTAMSPGETIAYFSCQSIMPGIGTHLHALRFQISNEIYKEAFFLTPCPLTHTAIQLPHGSSKLEWPGHEDEWDPYSLVKETDKELGGFSMANGNLSVYNNI